MNRSAWLVSFFSCVFFLNSIVCAQTGVPDPRNGSISGRITINGKPAVYKKVNAIESNPEVESSGIFLAGPGQSQTYSALTDADGRYRITGLPEGTFTVEAKMAAYVGEKKSGSRSRPVTLDRGEQVENIDLSLVRGGVISGRVTDSKGYPLIAKKVRLQRVQDAVENADPFLQGIQVLRGLISISNNLEDFETDDRGIYRAYGLPAGTYIISMGSGSYGDASYKYPLTYHPAVTDDKHATRIKVEEGSEVTGVDIQIGSARSTYEAVGKVIDAETELPLPRAPIVCYLQNEDSGEAPVNYQTNAITDERGNFRFSGLPSGRYVVSISPDFLQSRQSDYYTEGAIFRIVDANVSELEIRARRGGAISGVVVLENNRDQGQKARFAQTMLLAMITEKEGQPQAIGLSGQSMARINSDGSFRLAGLSSGEVQFKIFSPNGRPPELVRIERDGNQLIGNLEIKRGELINGVHLFFATGSGVIRGQVEIVGVISPEGTIMEAIAERAGAINADDNVRLTLVDKKGRFVFDGLLDGEYELLVQVPGITPPMPATQRVRIVNGVEAQVTLKLDFTKKDQ